MASTKRRAISRTSTLEMAFLIAMVALGAIYFVTLHPQPGASQGSTAETTDSTSTSQSTTQSQTSLTSTTSTPASSGSSSLTLSTTSSSSTAAPSKVSHVIIVLMENEEYGSVIGNASAPYENMLASSYATAGAYFAVAHPSLPNYLALVAGSTFGVTSDCLPSQCSMPSGVSTIASLLDSHHLTWKEYAESMPVNCSQANSPDGSYVTKHDPFVYFYSITGNDGTGATSGYCDSHVVSLGQFEVDLKNGNLPNLSFVTPNVCHDAHSCPLSTGDQWLSTFVPGIISSTSFGSTALFIVYDEGSSADGAGGGGQVACLLVSPLAKQGYVSQVHYSHYSLLATVEGIFDVGNLGRNDSSATTMSDMFANGLP